jgi:sugar lactone lactonase YvrE
MVVTVAAQNGPTGTSPGNFSATVTGLTPGTTYYYQAGATSSSGTSYGSIVPFTTASTTAGPPTVTTLPATAVTGTAATLNGSVNPNGSSSTSTFFQYSTDPNAAPNDVTTIAGTAGMKGYVNGPGLAGAEFNEPEGVAVDAAGNVYVADTVNYVIREIMPDGDVSLLAGTQGTIGTGNGTGIGVQFVSPVALAFDPNNGYLYVADMDAENIRAISPTQAVTTLAGSLSTGQYGLADGTGSAALFHSPQGIAFDPVDGNLYVADTANNAIRRVTPLGVVTTIAGFSGTAGNADGPVSTATFDGPTDIAVDAAGNIYVSEEFSYVVRKISTDGMVSTLAGMYKVPGAVNGTGTGALFDDPQGLAVDSAGDVFVADTFNDAIREITPDRVVSTVAGQLNRLGHEDGVGTAAQFELPYGLAIDTAGNLYVADTSNQTIRKLSVAGTIAATPTGLTGTTAVNVSAAPGSLTPGTTYYYRAGATNGSGTALGNVLSFVAGGTTAGAPVVVTTGQATAITDTTADVPATVNPEGSDTTVTVVYGTDHSLSSNTLTSNGTDAGNGTMNEPLTIALSGLAPQTTYYYEVMATNGGGTTTGTIGQFTTAAAVPTSIDATAGTPQSATAGTAFATALQATVDDQNGDPLPGANVTFTAPSGGAGGTFSGGQTSVTVMTNANGVATATAFAANGTAGSYTVTAAVAGISTPFALTNVAVPPAAIAFATGSVSANATDGSAAIVLTRSGNLAATLTVVLSSPGGTDVPPVQQTVTFGPNTTSLTVSVPIQNDGKPNEPDASIPLSLSSPGSGATLGTPTSATLLVHDNNPLPPLVTIVNLQVVPVKITTGTGKRARTTTKKGLQVTFSGAISGAGSLAAFHVFTGKTKNGVTTFSQPVPLASVVYNPASMIATLTPRNTLNLSQVEQFQVTSSLLTDIYGRQLDGKHNGQAGSNFAANFSAKGVQAAQVSSQPGIAALSAAAVDAIFEGK